MGLLTTILTALLVLSTLPASASQASGAASALVRPTAKSSWNADRKNPYSRLFKPSVPSTTMAPTPAARLAGKAEIKCGMMLIPIDPGIDPRMLAPPLPSSSTFTIRAVDPPICR